MTNITVNRKMRTLEITKKFDKASSKYGSDEYNELQNALAQNAGFKVVVKSSTSKQRETYKGLTYKYMEKYIKSHDEDGTIMEEYKMLRGISEEAENTCAQSLSYMEMKDWFLDKYSEIADFHKKREEIMKKVQERKAS